MSQIPTPPQSRGASIEPNEPNDEKSDRTTTTLDGKVQLLDSLLERYLHLLDTHQKLQESLGKQFSTGFFQLAHANYVSPGRRFGEDFYDERMKATRRLNITSLQDNEQSDSGRIDAQERVRFEVEYKSVLEPKDDEEKEEEVKDAAKNADKPATESVANPDNEEETKQQEDTSASGIATPPTQSTDTNNDADADDDKNEDRGSTATRKSTKKKKKIFRSDDPISWYGILVPSSLKNAQKSFIDAVDGGIPQIVSVMTEMRCVEDMVYELRREIDGKDEAE